MTKIRDLSEKSRQELLSVYESGDKDKLTKVLEKHGVRRRQVRSMLARNSGGQNPPAPSQRHRETSKVAPSELDSLIGLCITSVETGNAGFLVLRAGNAELQIRGRNMKALLTQLTTIELPL